METKERVRKWAGICYMVCLAVFLAYRAFDNTMIRKEFGITRCVPLEYCWMAVMILVIIVRMVYLKSYSKLELLVAVSFCAAMFLAWRCSGRYWIEMISLLVAGAKGVSFDKIIKIFLVTVGTLIGLSVILSLTGVVTNLEYIRYVPDASAPGGSIGLKRYAFGTTYPTTFSEFMFFLSAAWLYMRRRSVKIFDVIGLAAVAVLLYKGVDAITDVACVAALAVIALGVVVFRFVYGGAGVLRGRPEEKCERADAGEMSGRPVERLEGAYAGRPGKKRTGAAAIPDLSDRTNSDENNSLRKDRQIPRILHILCAPLVAVTAVCATAMTVMMICYDSTKSSWLTMDSLLHLRLSLGHAGLKEYGIHPFGALVKYRMTGGDVDLVNRADYFNLDCSYHLILLNFGVVILLFIVGLLTLACVRAWQMQDLVLLLIIVVISLECVMENRMIHPQFDVFLLVFFADVVSRSGKRYSVICGQQD